MSQMQIHKGIAYEGAPKVIMARIVGAAATNITQATVNAISYIADQYDSEPEAEADSSPTSIQVETDAGAVSSLVFNTLQTDNDWEADDEGYNFKMTLPPATFPLGNKWVRVSVWIDPTSGDDFPGFIGIFEVIATTKD
jgi:hypothetical protein